MKVSVVGIGCNNFGRRCDQGTTTEVVEAAIDLGVNFFDTADMYGPRGLSEEFLGNALANKDRDSIVIATKFANPMGESEHQRGASRRYIMNAVENSLRRLKTDYIDLYQQHVPDPSTPIEETLRALDDLVSQGKVRYIGHSNFSGWQIADADWTAQSHHLNKFVTAQNLYSLMDRRLEQEVVPACQRFNIGGLIILLNGAWRKLVRNILCAKMVACCRVNTPVVNQHQKVPGLQCGGNGVRRRCPKIILTRWKSWLYSQRSRAIRF